MFENVLVGYDGGPASDDAVALAEMLAGDGFSLLRVAGTPPARGLHELASLEGADLIVVGSTHRRALGRIFPGSTGERLLHGSPAAIAVAPPGFAENAADAGVRVVGVAYDGSDEADAALDTAVELALQAGAALRLVAVVQPGSVHPAPGYAPPAAALVQSEKARLDRCMADALERTPPEVRAQGKVLKGGTPAATIASEAETGIDVIVCGTRGHGPLRTALTGGVAGQLMRSSPCPVIVVPRRDRVDAEADQHATRTGVET